MFESGVWTPAQPSEALGLNGPVPEEQAGRESGGDSLHLGWDRWRAPRRNLKVTRIKGVIVLYYLLHGLLLLLLLPVHVRSCTAVQP
jgi:hypothetical protein